MYSSIAFFVVNEMKVNSLNIHVRDNGGNMDVLFQKLKIVLAFVQFPICFTLWVSTLKDFFKLRLMPQVHPTEYNCGYFQSAIKTKDKLLQKILHKNREEM